MSGGTLTDLLEAVERERDDWKEAARRRSQAWSEECDIIERRAQAAERDVEKWIDLEYRMMERAAEAEEKLEAWESHFSEFKDAREARSIIISQAGDLDVMEKRIHKLVADFTDADHRADAAEQQLKAIDDVLPWIGMGEGRVSMVRRLQSRARALSALLALSDTLEAFIVSGKNKPGSP